MPILISQYQALGLGVRAVMFIYIYLSDCILSSLLSREMKKVLHVDPRSFYGDTDASISLAQLQHLEDIQLSSIKLVNFSVNSSYASHETERHFSIDLSVPKLIQCRSKSVDLLINQGVSPYLSFASIKRMGVLQSDGNFLEIPTSRANIFKDRGLKLNEKRSIMNLFQSAAATGNSAIQSAAYTSQVGGVTVKDSSHIGAPSSAVEYLKTSFGIEREDLVAGIIHGACLYMRSAESMDVATLHARLSIFIESLAQYEEGCPFLVPMYGNCDIPQAFARNAAVHGALFVLNCDEKQLWSELARLDVQLPKEVSLASSPPPRHPALHGIACVKHGFSSVREPTLYVSAPLTLDKEPVFIIELPNAGSTFSTVSVCPEGFTLLHFVQLCSKQPSNETLEDVMARFLTGEEVVFQSILLNEDVGSDPFSLEHEFERARLAFNATMGYPLDAPLPTFTQRNGDAETQAE